MNKYGYLEVLDLNQYDCVYISYGSKKQVTENSNFQRYPDFLHENMFYPKCIVVSIDAYEEFSLVPLDPEYATGDDVTIPSHSESDIIAITHELVKCLDRHRGLKHLYIFNFIKIVDSSSHETLLELYVNKQLPLHLGRYTTNLYHWIGYNVEVNGEFYRVGLVDWVCKHSCFVENPFWLNRLTVHPLRRDLITALREKDSWERIDSILDDNLKHQKDPEDKKQECMSSFINIVITLMDHYELFTVPNVMTNREGGKRTRKKRTTYSRKSRVFRQSIRAVTSNRRWRI